MHDKAHEVQAVGSPVIKTILAVVLTAAAPWSLGAQQDSLKLSFLGSNLSADVQYKQTEEFRYRSGPLLAASEGQKQAATAAAGDKGTTDHSSLAETVTNPIGNLIQVQFQNTFIPSSWEASGYANQFVIQPVIPINLYNKIFPTLITRTTFPIVTTPDPDGPTEGTTGSGDTVFLAAFVNNQKWGMWGVGPTFTLPTASDSRTGSEKWQAGPTAILFYTGLKPFQLGFLTYLQQSFAGTSARDSVFKFFWQPILIYQLGNGWYTGLPDVLSITNFQTGGNTINFTGWRVGKVTKIKKQPLNVFLEAWGTPVHEGSVGQFSIKLSFSLLFPKKK